MGCGRCCHDTPRGSTAARARSAPCGPRVSAKDAAIGWVPSGAQSPFTPVHHKRAEVRVLAEVQELWLERHVPARRDTDPRRPARTSQRRRCGDARSRRSGRAMPVPMKRAAARSHGNGRALHASRGRNNVATERRYGLRWLRNGAGCSCLIPAPPQPERSRAQPGVPSCMTSPGWRGKGLECADSESNREPTD